MRVGTKDRGFKEDDAIPPPRVRRTPWGTKQARNEIEREPNAN